MKKVIAVFAVAAMFAACNNSSETATAAVDSATTTVDSAVGNVSAAIDTAAAKVDSAAAAIVDSAKGKAADVKEAVKK
jgi:uncharacterized lipoprotein YajG